jgi:xanthine dehydrogenase molybdopterin-binding subunit B
VTQVVADTAVAAAAGARLVKIVYEELPAILSIDDAIAAQSFFPTTVCLFVAILYLLYSLYLL